MPQLLLELFSEEIPARMQAQAARDLERIHDWLLRLEAWRYAAHGTSQAEHRRALGTLRRQLRQIRWPQRSNP